MFLSILRPLSFIFDPLRHGSISSMCMSTDGFKVLHSIPIHLILNPQAVQLIQEGKTSLLPTLFHNLSTDGR